MGIIAGSLSTELLPDKHLKQGTSIFSEQAPTTHRRTEGHLISDIWPTRLKSDNDEAYQH